MYKDLTLTDGERYFASIWNLCFMPISEEGHFPEFWHNELLRECSAFENRGTGKMSLVVCGSKSGLEALIGKDEQAEVFAYGAYNQIDVCQMRARGMVTRISGTAEQQVRGALVAQIKERRKASGNTNGMKDAEVAERLAIVESEPLYRFTPTGYAYDMYERG